MKHALRVLALLTLAAAGARAQSQVITQTVFSGITAPAVSTPVRNIGQSLHLITILFPAAAGAVSDLQIRLEASFDGTKWFPISPDVTAAPRFGSLTFQIEKAYAPWPYVRVASLATASTPMTVIYTGSTRPTVSAIETATDRFIL